MNRHKKRSLTVSARGNNMKKENSSTAFLDILRWCAAAMVVLFHVVSGVTSILSAEMTPNERAVYYTLKALMTAGVPIFLMISGALLLNPEKEISGKKILSHYLKRILLALLLFGTVFSVMELAVTEGSFSPAMIWRGFLNTLSGKSWAHLWYLYELAGLYLATPLLRAAVKHFGRQLLKYSLVLGFLFASIIPFAEQLTGFDLGFIYPFSRIYLLYYVFGYYLLKYVKIQPRISAAAAVITVGILIADMAFLKLFRVSYDSPLIVLLAASLFLTASGRRPHISWMSRHRNLCFGIYLVHPVFLNLFYKFFQITPLDLGYVGIPVFWAGAFLLSCLGSWIMQKIPLLKKYVV